MIKNNFIKKFIFIYIVSCFSFLEFSSFAFASSDNSDNTSSNDYATGVSYLPYFKEIYDISKITKEIYDNGLGTDYSDKDKDTFASKVLLYNTGIGTVEQEQMDISQLNEGYQSGMVGRWQKYEVEHGRDEKKTDAFTRYIIYSEKMAYNGKAMRGELDDVPGYDCTSLPFPELMDYSTDFANFSTYDFNEQMEKLKNSALEEVNWLNANGFNNMDTLTSIYNYFGAVKEIYSNRYKSNNDKSLTLYPNFSDDLLSQCRYAAGATYKDYTNIVFLAVSPNIGSYKQIHYDTWNSDLYKDERDSFSVIVLLKRNSFFGSPIFDEYCLTWSETSNFKCRWLYSCTKSSQNSSFDYVKDIYQRMYDLKIKFHYYVFGYEFSSDIINRCATKYNNRDFFYDTALPLLDDMNTTFKLNTNSYLINEYDTNSPIYTFPTNRLKKIKSIPVPVNPDIPDDKKKDIPDVYKLPQGYYVSIPIIHNEYDNIFIDYNKLFELVNKNYITLQGFINQFNNICGQLSVTLKGEVNPTLEVNISPGKTTTINQYITDNENYKKDNYVPYEVDMTDVFPFCLPFDVYDLLKCFNAPAVTPKFQMIVPKDWDTTNRSDDMYQDVDLSPFEPLAAIVRVGSLILFTIGMCALFFRESRH